jgi:hypothetical protein
VTANLTSSLLSVDAASEKDVLVVGADKGRGPMVLHFDGSIWSKLETGQHGDLWWVHMFPDGTALLGGSGAMVLRFSGGKFERIPTPGLARQTVYGIWGLSPSDFYATGSSTQRNGFIWHYQNGAFSEESLPPNLPLTATGQPPGYFKAWGHGEDVWVVGTAGAVLHKQGTSRFTIVPSLTKEALFTVHGTGDHVLAVGGGSNGVVLEEVAGLDPGGRGASGTLLDVSPPGAALLQGVFASDDGDWVSGQRGSIFFRRGKDPFRAIEHGLPIPPALSLHTIVVDRSHGVWAAGGNVLSPARDQGLLVHFGPKVPEIDPSIDEPAESAGGCPPEVVTVAKKQSIARRWNEQALAAIRLDLPRPTVHARNLFHLSAAMWDAWAAYDPEAEGVFVHEREHADDLEGARKKAISYAAFGTLAQRYKEGRGAETTRACLESVMRDLGYDPADTHREGNDPVALGNRIARQVLAQATGDGSNESGDYLAPLPFVSPNPALISEHPGTAMTDPSAWQPIYLPGGAQTFETSQWGAVTPFALKQTSGSGSGSGSGSEVGSAPKVGAEMKRWVVEVLRKESELDPADGATLDIAPDSMGHHSLGANDGKGWAKNPVTGKSYAPEIALRADFGRVVAEFWGDGPPAGPTSVRWNVLANQVADSPELARRLFGKGLTVDALSWDVHLYLALNGALHDAAIATWDVKRRTASARPISLVRWMGGNGQSSSPNGAAFSEDGLPLVEGLIELVTDESSQPGQRHEDLRPYVGQVAVRGWLGEPADPSRRTSGVGWVRAVDWIPYQARTWVTPPSPGFVSESSAESRAAAEVLASLTGSPYFPGGFAEFVAPAGIFLSLEKGPSQTVRLEWASYADAADQAGQAGLWGGTQLAPDDLSGRRVGSRVGRAAVLSARSHF